MEGRRFKFFSLNHLLCLLAVLLFTASTANAQTAGEGALQGSVTDPSGAAIPNVTVTAVNVSTGVHTSQVSTSAGLYNISPLLPGTYKITATVNGFESFTQENMVIDAMHVSGLNITMKVGSTTEEVTVTSAPPQLETTNGTLGGTIKADEYMDLPLLVSGNQQRDITQFSNLLPGAQLNPGGRSSIIGGTQQRLGEEYLDGLPVTTISQQGDNRPIFNVVPLESISEIQVVTSGFSAEYQGIGLENYTMKSGTNQYHGTAADFIRNTIFDTWGFSAPWSTIVNAQGVKGFQNQVGTKPVDHQNEFTASFGGPLIIPHLFNGRDKLFFEGTYDRVHTRSAPTYAFDTLPTALMQKGNFCELLIPTGSNGGCGVASGSTVAPNLAIYDPTTQTCPTPTTCTRTAFAGNIIPAAEQSPISQYLQKFLPPLTNGNISNNYLGGIPNGYDNYLWGGRIDYALSDRQRLSIVAADGRRHAVPYTSGSANLPVPYLASTLSTVVGDLVSLEHSFMITPRLVNQFAVAYFYFGGPPVRNNEEGVTQYEAPTAGITGLPAGQASDQFPGVSFTGTDGGTAWAQPDITNKTVSHTYDVVDNVNWIKGKHSFNFGIQLQDLMENNSSFNTLSSPITYAYNSTDTSNLLYSSNAYSYNTAKSGFAYASFLLGAVNSANTTLQPFTDIGSRYHTIAPYVQDDFKITAKLTLNLGLRWDYLPPFHEVLDRWSFLNATLTNSYTGNPGSLQFAGNYGGAGVSCGCTTPVKTWMGNWGPRVGFSYEADTNTVFRGGFAMLYSHGGGTGGAGATGTGQTGFSIPDSYTSTPAGTTAAPAFYLNNSAYFQGQGISNTAFGGPTATIPTIPSPSATTQLTTSQVGNFVNGAGVFVKSTAGIAYADPYYGDRTPTVYFYNFGFQRAFSSSITFSLNYAGSTSHFLSGASGIRGLQSGEINPIYLQLGSLLTVAATPANIAKAQAIMPGCCSSPYPGFAAAAATSAGASIATIGQGLKWMPQFSGTTDTWGAYTANAAYNAMQASLAIRPTHGVTLNVNYTWSKEMDDAGTIRTGFPIPAFANATGQAWKADRMDRSLSTIDSPQNLAAYGTWALPFGRGHIGGQHFLVRALAQGWVFSSIMTYASGYPLTLSSSSCTATSLPGQGTCMPDLNPAFSGPILSSGWKKGVTALSLGTTPYIREGLNGVAGYNSSTTPGSGGQYTQTVGGVTTTVQVPCAQSGAAFCNPASDMIGDAPRTGAYGLRTPGNFRLSSGIRRTFPIHDNVNFIFGVDCQNVTNSVTFGVNAGNLEIPTAINTSSFGELSYASGDSRDFQFSGRITF